MNAFPRALLVLAIVALSVACGAAPARDTAHVPVTPGDHEYQLTVGATARRYTVHVPPGYDGRTAVPVVMMLHGGGGTSRAAATETAWDAKADQAGFLAVFPDALPPDPAKRSSFARNPQLWNDGSERFYAGQNAVDDVGFLNAVLDDASVRFAVDARRVFVTGFSNGASMTFRFAAEASARLAAIAPVAGACWIEPQGLEHAVPMLYITGTADPLNLIEGGVPKLLNGGSDTVRAKAKPPVRDSILKWVRASGCPEKPVRVSEVNGVRTETHGPGRDGTEVVYTTVEDLGHTWAGGRSLLPQFLVGRTSSRIRATDVIWGFFMEHPQSGIVAGAANGGLGEPIPVTSGPVTGEERNGVRGLKGVPFAAPPVGALRWKPPQPE